MPIPETPHRSTEEPQPPQEELSVAGKRGVGWGAALLMAAAPFLLLALLILADRLFG